MQNNKIIAIAVVVLIVAAAGTGAFFLLKDKDKVDAWKEGDMITIATSPDFAPYDDLIGDKYVGVDMDILRAVFVNMNLTEGTNYKFETVSFDSIVLGVTQGKYTIGASGFTQTADRMANVLFTEEYAVTNQCVVTLLGNPNGVTAANLNTKTIVVETGTTGDNIARENFAKDDAQSNIKSLNTYSDTIMAVKNGTADCIIVDHETALGMVAKTASEPEKLEIRSEIILPGENEYYSFVLNKVNTDLCMKITTILRDMKASAAQNAVKDIIDYYAAHDNESGTPSFWDTHNLNDYKLYA